jgi:alpha-galactosidase
MRSLPPDWAGRAVTSLVSSAPMGVLYNSGGRVLFGWAADEPVDEVTIRYGVSEEHKTFAVELHAAAATEERRLELVLDATTGSLAEVVQRLAAWMSRRIVEPALAVPPLAIEPVYSTWYTFTQDVNAEVIESEAALAVPMGCGTVFIDDGWQQLAVGRGYQGCGDWVPDTAKFPDLLAHIRRVRAIGAGVVLWVAPLLLGGQRRVRRPRRVRHSAADADRLLHPRPASPHRPGASCRCLPAVGHRLRGRRPQDRLLGPGDALPGHATMA